MTMLSLQLEPLRESSNLIFKNNDITIKPEEKQSWISREETRTKDLDSLSLRGTGRLLASHVMTQG